MAVNIISYIRIKNHEVILNGTPLTITDLETPFLKSLYKQFGVKYPKFYKMDELSKLGFITCELLLQSEEAKKIATETDPEKFALILQNASSTIDVDSNFYDSISDEDKHFPSPALFVYTLPNIVLGEIAIRNKFRGENALFIFEKYQAEMGVDYINTLFTKDKIDACIGGWFEARNGNYDAFFYLVSKGNGTTEAHTIENIKAKY